MSRAHRFVRLATAVTSVFILAQAALAVENVVSPPATPAPAAGPTIAAAQQFCGDAPDKAEALITRYSTDAKLKQVYKSVDYVAYGDDDKNATKMYTFTISGHPAHPAAVCRTLVKEGESLVVKMHVVCDGEQEACTRLRNDFNVMTAKMQVEVDQRIAGEKK
ncbi:MAG: hypothetical protein K2X41_13895 [Hyphomicrobium sp.]|nr:hypothetical protein [Hyphomicrobium sp.]